MEHKHTPIAWTKTSESLPAEYAEVYAKHKDGSVRIARLSKAEGGCWQLATFLIGTKRPGYAWPVESVVAWRPIQPDTAASRDAHDLLSALETIAAGNTDPDTMVEIARAAIAKATGEPR